VENHESLSRGRRSTALVQTRYFRTKAARLTAEAMCCSYRKDSLFTGPVTSGYVTALSVGVRGSDLVLRVRNGISCKVNYSSLHRFWPLTLLGKPSMRTTV
jgi:hypothetical protein